MDPVAEADKAVLRFRSRVDGEADDQPHILDKVAQLMKSVSADVQELVEAMNKDRETYKSVDTRAGAATLCWRTRLGVE